MERELIFMGFLYSITIASIRGGSWTAVTSKMGLFVIIVNGFQPSTIITKLSIFVVAAVLAPLHIR